MINDEIFDLIDNSNQVSTQKLENFVNILENGMSNWLKEFEWNKHEILNSNNEKSKYFNCPFDSGHKNISEKNFEKHVKKCRLKHSSMTNQDVIDFNKQPDVHSPFQVVIDKQTQEDVLKNLSKPEPKSSGLLPIPFEYNPMNYRDDTKKNQKVHSKDREVSLTTNHLYTNFTPNERLLLHEYAVHKSKSMGYKTSIEQNQVITEDLNEIKVDGEEASNVKEHKRRPKSYRTSKTKTHTDALRELIDSQMEYLKQSNEKSNLKRSSSRSTSRNRSSNKKTKS